MTSSIDLMMSIEIEMLVYESKCFNNFICRMTFSKSDDDIKTFNNFVIRSKVKKSHRRFIR
jgi:hypothetical protein